MPTTPVYGNLWRVTYAGHLPGGEIFDHGFWMTTDTPAYTDADAAAAGGDWLTAWLNSPALSVGATDVRHLFDAGIGWDKIVVREHSPTTGLPLRAPYTATTAVTGAGLGLMPPQCSVVQTLWNGRVVGRDRYNRFFIPPMEQSVLNSNGRLFSGLPADLNTAVEAAQLALQARTPKASMIYWSQRHVNGTGLLAPMCDDVVDTMRSRRNQLVPVRTTGAF